MYEILYTKRAAKDIDKLKSSPTLYRKYEERENLIASNPYSPDVPQGDFSKMKGYKNLYHVRINQKHRIFYSITKIDDHIEVDIEGIEIEGKVKILQAYGHDFE